MFRFMEHYARAEEMSFALDIKVYRHALAITSVIGLILPRICS